MSELTYFRFSGRTTEGVVVGQQKGKGSSDDNRGDEVDACFCRLSKKINTYSKRGPFSPENQVGKFDFDQKIRHHPPPCCRRTRSSGDHPLHVVVGRPHPPYYRPTATYTSRCRPMTTHHHVVIPHFQKKTRVVTLQERFPS